MNGFRTLDEECLLVHEPGCSELRIRDVEQFVWYYNHQRAHLSLHGLTRIQRRQTYLLDAFTIGAESIGEQDDLMKRIAAV